MARSKSGGWLTTLGVGAVIVLVTVKFYTPIINAIKEYIPALGDILEQ